MLHHLAKQIVIFNIIMQISGDVNLLRIPSKDAYAYGRALLDQLFTKHEQKTSIVLKSKKSAKPPLSPKRVEQMFGKSCTHARWLSR